MYRTPLLFTALLMLAGPAGADDTGALLAEERDAVAREQRELAERAEALAAQLKETQRLLELQEAYLQRLSEEVARHGDVTDATP